MEEFFQYIMNIYIWLITYIYMYINDRLCSPMISRFPTFLSTIIYLGGDRMTIRHPKKLFAQCGNMLNWDPYIIAVTLNSNHLSLCWQAVISWNQASPSKKHPSKPVLIFYGAGSRKMPKSKARFPHHVDEIPRFSTNPHRGNCEICTLQCNKSTGKWYKSLNSPFFFAFLQGKSQFDPMKSPCFAGGPWPEV